MQYLSFLNAFTEEYNVTVTYLVYASMELAAQMSTNQEYYSILLENNNIEPLVSEGFLADKNYEILTNLKNNIPNFHDLKSNSEKHSIPYNHGTIGLLVSSDLVYTLITCWVDLWNPHFTDKIAMRAQFYESIVVVLNCPGNPLYSRTFRELQATLRHLLELKPALVFVDDQSCKAIPTPLNGETEIMVGWRDDTLQTLQKNGAAAYFLSEGGSLLWDESFIIPANSRRNNTVKLFLNILLHPGITTQFVNGTHFATTSDVVYLFIIPEILNNLVARLDARSVAKYIKGTASQVSVEY